MRGFLIFVAGLMLLVGLWMLKGGASYSDHCKLDHGVIACAKR